MAFLKRFILSRIFVAVLLVCGAECRCGASVIMRCKRNRNLACSRISRLVVLRRQVVASPCMGMDLALPRYIPDTKGVRPFELKLI